MNLLLRRRLLSASAMASVLSLAPLAANAGALPSGGHYVSGRGEIGKAGQSLTVKQSSTTGIIDWNKFSIGHKNNVTFDNGSGATLNRVKGGNLSTIAGNLHATGSLYLMNSSGVVISGTGRVVTGGSFLASTSDPAGDGLNSTDLRKTNASVVNRGKIVASGDVTLVGGNLRSTGSIKAAKVDLEGGKKIVISGAIAAKKANGDGGTIIVTSKSIDVTGSAHLSASGEQGGTILIGGDIHGGAIASDNFVNHTVGNAQRTMIGAGAQIDANGRKSTGGNIVIWSDGHTSFAGQIDAKGKTAGGFAEVSSHDLLAFTGRVDLTSAHGSTGTLLLDPENVTIANGTTANGTLSGGTFTPSGDDSVLSVSDLEAALNSANVTVTTGTTGSQAGNITVASAITWSWNANTTLTLNAAGNIAIEAPINAIGEEDAQFGSALTLIAGGTITESGDGAIEVNNFSGSSVGGALLSGDNLIYNASFTNTGGGNVVLAGVVNVQAINVGAGNLTLSQTKVGGYDGFSINGLVTAGTVNLKGQVSESGAGAIITNELSGNFNGGLGGPNQIAELGPITVMGTEDAAPAPTDLTINDTIDLTVAGNIATGQTNGQLSIIDRGDITIQGVIGKSGDASDLDVKLAANGTITESGAGAISTSKLTSSSGGSTTLNGNNTIGALVINNTGAGDVSIKDTNAEMVIDEANAGSGNLTLVSTASAGIEIEGALTANNLVLDSAGAIASKSAGVITSNSLSGSALGEVSLAGNIGTLSSFETSGNPLSIVDTGALTISGPVAVGEGTLSLSGDGIAIDGTLQGTELSLKSLGDISENNFGYIDATTLTGSAGGKAILNASNTIADLGAFATAGNFALTDRASKLTIEGNVTSQTGNIFLTGISTKTSIAVNGTLQAAEVDFVSANSVVEGKGGAINATTLRGDVYSEVTLMSATNAITNLGGFYSAGFVLIDSSGLTVDGPVTADSNGDISLTTNTAHDGIAIDGVLKGTTVDLVSASTIKENSAGAIEATTFEGSSDGSVGLSSADNAFNFLNGFNSSGFNFIAVDDAALTTEGTVVTGASTIQLKTTGSGNSLAMKGNLDGGKVSLSSAAKITENSSAVIHATTLTGSSDGAVNLASDDNVITSLAAFNTGGDNNMTLVDDHGLTASGTVNTGAGILELKTVGSGHALAVGSELNAGTIDLISATNMTESSSGAILASVLNATAQTGITLTSSKNRITKVGTDKTTSGPNKITL